MNVCRLYDDIMNTAEELATLIAEAELKGDELDAVWQDFTGQQHGSIVHQSLQELSGAIQYHALQTALDHANNQLWPYLDVSKLEWMEMLRNTDLHPTHILAKFIGKVNMTAEANIYAKAYRKARNLIPKQRRSYTGWIHSLDPPKGQVMKLRCQLWDAGRYVPGWTYKSWQREYLIGLEIITRKAAGQKSIACVRMSIVNAAIRLTAEPCVTFTGWSLIPQVRTFKNGRLDVTFRDAELAQAVADVLNGEQEVTNGSS